MLAERAERHQLGDQGLGKKLEGVALNEGARIVSEIQSDVLTNLHQEFEHGVTLSVRALRLEHLWTLGFDSWPLLANQSRRLRGLEAFEIFDQRSKCICHVLHMQLDEGDGVLAQDLDNARRCLVENDLSMHVGYGATLSLRGLVCPLDQLDNHRTQLILVELDHKLLEGMNDRLLDLFKTEHVNFIVVLEIEPWEVEHLLEELANLLEVFGAELLLHAHHDWL